MKIDRSEVFRYMGERLKEPSQLIADEVDSICERMEKLVKPHYVYKIFTPTLDDSSVTVGGKRFVSKSIAKHLSGCERVAVLAGTLGTSSDLLIRECAVRGTIKLSSAQAAGTAMLEQVLDLACDDIRNESGLYPIPRFSAGYGDFPLEYQADILALCDAEKRIGITLTSNMMMIPSKSVTAFVGLRASPCTLHTDCTNCIKKDCEYRK